MKNTVLLIMAGCYIVTYSARAQAQTNNETSAPFQTAGASLVEATTEEKEGVGYEVGIDDALEISVLQPEKFLITVTVAPDGLITFPYIGGVQAKNRTLSQIQEEIQNRLADGYMRYPVVSVSLKESRSKKFFVYGEVIRPGTYLLDEYTTVFKAISMAGGFSKYGSASRVKVLRPGPENKGTEVIKVNINAVMEGNSKEDVQLRSGDTVVVSEGMF